MAHPSPLNPLGVSYPGETFCYGEPNWVGHFVTKYSPGSNFIPHTELDERGTAVPSSIVVFDYAVGGDAVQGVRTQISRQFFGHIACKPDWAAWTSQDTLFGARHPDYRWLHSQLTADRRTHSNLGWYK